MLEYLVAHPTNRRLLIIKERLVGAMSTEITRVNGPPPQRSLGSSPPSSLIHIYIYTVKLG